MKMLSHAGFDLNDNKIGVLHQPCIALLDLTYIKHSQIYQNLYCKLSDSQNAISDLGERVLKYDYKLLAVAIVMSASFIVVGKKDKNSYLMVRIVPINIHDDLLYMRIE